MEAANSYRNTLFHLVMVEELQMQLQNEVRAIAKVEELTQITVDRFNHVRRETLTRMLELPVNASANLATGTPLVYPLFFVFIEVEFGDALFYTFVQQHDSYAQFVKPRQHPYSGYKPEDTQALREQRAREHPLYPRLELFRKSESASLLGRLDDEATANRTLARRNQASVVSNLTRLTNIRKTLVENRLATAIRMLGKLIALILRGSAPCSGVTEPNEACHAVYPLSPGDYTLLQTVLSFPALDSRTDLAAVRAIAPRLYLASRT